MDKKIRLAILGAGEFGRQITHYAHLSGVYDVVAFFDDIMSTETSVLDIPILGGMNDVLTAFKDNKFDKAFIGLGYAHFDVKDHLLHFLKENNIPLATIVSPNVYIDPTAKIGDGVILYPGCVIDKDVVLKDNVAVNVSTTVAHNSVVGENTFLAGGSTMAGYSSIGKNCFLGVNSVINDHISVGDNIVIASLTVVSKKLKNPGTYFNDNRRIFSM